MLANREAEPFVLTFAPKRYEMPDWEETATVARVWVPDNETVGWVVWQDPDRLAWLSNVSPDSLGGPIRERIDALMRVSPTAGYAARETWDTILASTLHTTPTDQYLPALLADIRREWEE